MPHWKTQVAGQSLPQARRVLSNYLTGLDVGLVPLSTTEALLPDTTLAALKHTYGAVGALAVLSHAGLSPPTRVPDAQALALLQQRDIHNLPPRAAAVASQRLWHLDATRARAAWQFWGGPAGIPWGGVKVGQVDTGYSQHPALGFAGGASWVQVGEARTFYAPGAGPGGPGPGDGVDALEAQFDGHGTRVASVICGDDAAAPGGAYLGVAPRVPLVPVRIANVVLITHAQRELAEALRYLVHSAKVSVINLSMGFLPRTQMKVLDRAIDECYEAGVILVCAAGQPLRSVVSPAHGRRTIAVAGSTPEGIPWGDSACGTAVDWTAPAKGIYRADAKHGGRLTYAGGGDGTSYAAAITTGAAALWLARHGPALQAAYPQPWQVVEAFKAVARVTAAPMPHQQPGAFGTGILDIAALTAATLPPSATLVQEVKA